MTAVLCTNCRSWCTHQDPHTKCSKAPQPTAVWLQLQKRSALVRIGRMLDRSTSSSGRAQRSPSHVVLEELARLPKHILRHICKTTYVELHHNLGTSITESDSEVHTGLRPKERSLSTRPTTSGKPQKLSGMGPTRQISPRKLPIWHEPIAAPRSTSGCLNLEATQKPHKQSTSDNPNSKPCKPCGP